MVVVVALFLAAVVRAVWGVHHDPGYFTHPFYEAGSFYPSSIFAGTSVAVLTYIGFDGISTLTDEAKNPARDITRAIVLTCLITGVLASIEVYLAQLVWPRGMAFPDVDTA